MVVNVWERISVERWIFTTAHELGHLLLHRDAYAIEKRGEDAGEEEEADVFASHFLMPQDVFEREWTEARGLSFVERVLNRRGSLLESSALRWRRREAPTSLRTSPRTTSSKTGCDDWSERASRAS